VDVARLLSDANWQPSGLLLFGCCCAASRCPTSCSNSTAAEWLPTKPGLGAGSIHAHVTYCHLWYVVCTICTSQHRLAHSDAGLIQDRRIQNSTVATQDKASAGSTQCGRIQNRLLVCIIQTSKQVWIDNSGVRCASPPALDGVESLCSLLHCSSTFKAQLRQLHLQLLST
jgi:hypothetical protein